MTASEEFTRQRLLEVQTLTPNLFTLRTSRDPGFRFHCRAVRPPRRAQAQRLYCLACLFHGVGAARRVSRFLLSIVVPDGEFTSELSRLEVGDELLVDKQAFGFLTLDRFPDGRDLWLLATGTGIARFFRSCRTSRPGSASSASFSSTACARELAYQQLIAELPQRDYLKVWARSCCICR